jgi:hypothetical protein
MFLGAIVNNGQNKVYSTCRYDIFVKSYVTKCEEPVGFAVAFLGSLYQLSSYRVLLSLNVRFKYAIFYFTKYFENFL